MIERGILFSGPMVRALLDGSKTQTRRVVTMPRSWDCFVCADWGSGWWPYRSDDGENPTYDNNEIPLNCPYGKPGDRLWVRETFADLNGTGVEHYDQGGRRQRYSYAADITPGSHADELRKEYGLKWTPSIHMPRPASRILLEITGVRVERLQDISDQDAVAEGLGLNAKAIGVPLTGTDETIPYGMYRTLWEDINGAGSWDANPWVWVVEFKRVETA